MKQHAQVVDGVAQLGARALDAGEGMGESRRAWLSAADAARYVGCKTTRAFYTWRRVRGLVPNGRGWFARRDLDKALAVPRKRHAMNPNSLANLHARQCARSPLSVATSER